MDGKIRLYQLCVPFIGSLNVDLVLDEFLAWQRFPFPAHFHQRGGLRDFRQINRDRIGNPFRVGRHDHHLARQKEE